MLTSTCPADLTETAPECADICWLRGKRRLDSSSHTTGLLQPLVACGVVQRSRRLRPLNHEVLGAAQEVVKTPRKLHTTLSYDSRFLYRLFLSGLHIFIFILKSASPRGALSQYAPTPGGVLRYCIVEVLRCRVVVLDGEAVPPTIRPRVDNVGVVSTAAKAASP